MSVCSRDIKFDRIFRSPFASSRKRLDVVLSVSGIGDGSEPWSLQVVAPGLMSRSF